MACSTGHGQVRYGPTVVGGGRRLRICGAQSYASEQRRLTEAPAMYAYIRFVYCSAAGFPFALSVYGQAISKWPHSVSMCMSHGV